MKNVLKSMMVGLGSTFFGIMFGFNVDAMKIEVPVFHRDPQIGYTRSCDNCDSLLVKVKEESDKVFTFNVQFHSTQNPDNNLDIVFRDYDEFEDEDVNNWRPLCNNDIILPINNIPANVFEALKISSSAYLTSYIIGDSYSGVNNCVNDFADNLARMALNSPVFSEYLDSKHGKAIYWEFKTFESYILPYLEDALIQ